MVSIFTCYATHVRKYRVHSINTFIDFGVYDIELAYPVLTWCHISVQYISGYENEESVLDPSICPFFIRRPRIVFYTRNYTLHKTDLFMDISGSLITSYSWKWKTNSINTVLRRITYSPMNMPSIMDFRSLCGFIWNQLLLVIAFLDWRPPTLPPSSPQIRTSTLCVKDITNISEGQSHVLHVTLCGMGGYTSHS